MGVSLKDAQFKYFGEQIQTYVTMILGDMVDWWVAL